MNTVTFRGAVGLIATAALLAAMPAAAQGYPERTITMVVPFGAGGSTDIVGRIAADAMSKVLGVSMIIENKGAALAAAWVPTATRSPCPRPARTSWAR